VDELLRAPWWTGAGGIAQIIAGIFALWTVRQASIALRQAEASRREAVAPDWDVLHRDLLCRGDEVVDTDLQLINTGYGPARAAGATYVARPTGGALELRTGPLNHGQPILPEWTLDIRFTWRKDDPPNGDIAVSCRSRFGDRIEHRVYVLCELDEGKPHCRAPDPVLVLPADPARPRWRPW
jgi:hypothetical protein